MSSKRTGNRPIKCRSVGNPLLVRSGDVPHFRRDHRPCRVRSDRSTRFEPGMRCCQFPKHRGDSGCLGIPTRYRHPNPHPIGIRVSCSGLCACLMHPNPRASLGCTMLGDLATSRVPRRPARPTGARSLRPPETPLHRHGITEGGHFPDAFGRECRDHRGPWDLFPDALARDVHGSPRRWDLFWSPRQESPGSPRRGDSPIPRRTSIAAPGSHTLADRESRDTSVPSGALVCVPERFLSRPRTDRAPRASTGIGAIDDGACHLLPFSI
jgi:hypothetical protein